MDWLGLTLNVVAATLAVVAAALPLYERYRERKKHIASKQLDDE